MRRIRKGKFSLRTRYAGQAWLVAAITAFFATANLPWAYAGASSSQDVLELLREGKISTKLSAKDAFHLTVRVKNRSDKDMQVEFPPGLVADGFIQNQVLAQIGQGRGQGAQGLGFIENRKVYVAAGEEVAVDFRTCCLNYGVPEPKPKDLLFLKSVKEYTPNRRVHSLLTSLARANADTEVAQAALWHVTNGMSWQLLSRKGIQRGRPFSPQKLALAQKWFERVDQPTGDFVAVRANAGSNIKAPALSLAINPDPRGAVNGGLVRDVARLVSKSYPALAVSHTNYTGDVLEPKTQWSVLIQSPRNSKRPMVLTLQHSQTLGNPHRWKHDKPEVVRFPSPRDSEEETSTIVAKRLMEELAARSIQVRWTGRGKNRKVSVRNALPVPLESVTVRNSRDSEARVQLSSVEIPAGATVAIPLDEEQVRKLSSARRLLACGYKVSR